MTNKATTKARATVLLVLLTVFAVTGCSSSAPKNRGFNESFTTRITGNGTKLFEYRLEIPEREIRPQSHISSNTAINAEGPEGRAKRMRRRLESQLNSLLEENRYCREGFLEIDRSIYGGGRTMLGEGLIRGECREGATAEDRRRFPNSG